MKSKTTDYQNGKSLKIGLEYNNKSIDIDIPQNFAELQNIFSQKFSVEKKSPLHFYYFSDKYHKNFELTKELNDNQFKEAIEEIKKKPVPCIKVTEEMPNDNDSEEEEEGEEEESDDKNKEGEDDRGEMSKASIFTKKDPVNKGDKKGEGNEDDFLDQKSTIEYPIEDNKKKM